jgi:hypothetical protein
MKSEFKRGAVLGALMMLMVAAGVCRAAAITYQVNQGPFGIDGAKVIGIIGADGGIGVLAASNFLSWNIVVSDGLGGAFDLTNGNSTLSLTGTAFAATATELRFNFGGTGDFEILDASNGWGWALNVPSVGLHLQAVLPWVRMAMPS